MTAPPLNGDDPASLARRCWNDLEAQRRRRGVTLRDLEDQLKNCKLPRKPPAYNTLQNWFARRTSLPDKLVFLEIVKLLELDEQHWARRWEQWDRAQYAPRANVAQSDLTNSDNDAQPNSFQPEPIGQSETVESDTSSSSETERNTTETVPRRRHVPRKLVVMGAAAGVILAGLGVAQAVRQWGDAEEEGGSIKCATVAVATADVFEDPQRLRTIAVKRQGNRITLPSGHKDALGSDGRRYRVVFTPTRTPSGQAYMLADTLAPTNC